MEPGIVLILRKMLNKQNISRSIKREVYFLENIIYIVKVPKSEQSTPQVREAKENKMKNLEDYEMFELVEDFGQ